jgi:hypothetical protein
VPWGQSYEREPGLPDFSWSKIPKRGKFYPITTKCTKCPLNISNGHKINKYVKIFHSKTLQNLPKLGFWFENKPSGNPGVSYNASAAKKLQRQE